MASTVSKKRQRRPATAVNRKPVRRPATVAEMTPEQLRRLIEQVLDERLGDPDAGLELRPEVVAGLREQDARVAAGERGKPLADVMKELGLE